MCILYKKQNYYSDYLSNIKTVCNTCYNAYDNINFDITNPGGQTLINGEAVPPSYFHTAVNNTSDRLVIESESGSITVTKADVEV